MDKIVWTDSRGDNNTGLYMFLGDVPGIDLAVINGSIEFVSTSILPTANKLRFGVENLGGIVYDVDVTVTFGCEDSEGNMTYTDVVFENCISQLNSGTNSTYLKTLFQTSLNGLFYALIDFAGLKSVTVTVHHPDDVDLSNNAVTLGPENVSYESIFAYLYPFESLFLLLK